MHTDEILESPQQPLCHRLQIADHSLSFRHVLQICFVATIVTPLTGLANPGFFAEEWQTRKAPSIASSDSITSPTGPADTRFSIQWEDTTAKVLPTVFGNNANPWLGKSLLNDDDYGLEHLRQANIHTLRMPGGNWSNNWLWDGTVHWSFKLNYADSLKSLPTKTWTLTSDQLLELAADINASPQICVNFALSRFINSSDAVPQAAHYAADWVRHVNDTLGLNVKYWEIGNENYGSWQTGWLVNGDTLDGNEYGAGFRVFADSMKAADPTIKVGAVVVEQDNGKNSGGYRWWMKTMLPEIENSADYLAYHEYFTWESDINTVTVDDMLSALHKIRDAKDSIETMVERYTSKSRDHFPIAMTEWNVRAGTKTQKHVSAVFIANALGEFIRHGYGLANLWDIVNGWDDVEGDHGMLSVDEPGLQDYTPHPSFYTFWLATRWFGDVMVQSSPEDSNGVRAYATRFSDGTLSVLLVNQTSSSRTVALDMNGFSGNGHAYGYTLKADSATASLIRLNGKNGSGIYGPSDYTQILPWRQSIGTEPLLNAPAWSVQFIAFPPDQATQLKKTVPTRSTESMSTLRWVDLLGRSATPPVK